MKEQNDLRDELLAAVQQLENSDKEVDVIEEEVKTEESDQNLIEESSEYEDKEDQEDKQNETKDDKQDFDNKGFDLKKTLSGQPREFREAVESIKDAEAQARVIEAGKILRAREDQVRLELGNTKKELANLKAFDEAFKKNPAQTLKDLAKFANVDLNSLIDSVQEEYDYRTPEEIAKDEKLKNIESELNQLKNSKSEELIEIINQEIDDFANSKDEDGDLKYPYFEKLEDEIFDILAIFNQKQGFPKNAKERKERLALAYKKAELMDDDLVAQKQEAITKKAEEKRKMELEKAKKLKKFSGKSSSVSVKPANDRAELLDIIRKSGINW